MARIQSYQRQVSREAVAQPQVNPSGMGNGAGISAVGEGLQDLGQQVHKYEVEKDVFKTTAYLNAKRDAALKDMAAAADADENFGEGFTKKVEEQFSKIEEEAASLPQYSESRKVMTDGLYRMKSSLVTEAMGIESKKQAIKVKNTIQDSEQSTLNNITLNPRMAKSLLDEHLNLVNAVPNSSLDQTRKSQYASEASFKAYDTALDSLVRSSTSNRFASVGTVDKLIKELKDEKSGWSKNTTNPQFEKALFTLANAKETLLIKGQTEAKASFEEYMSQVEDQGIPNTKYNSSSIAAMTDSPLERRKLQERMEIAQNRSEGTRYVKNTSTPEIVSKLSSLSAELKNVDSNQYNEKLAEYNRISEAYTKRQKQLKEDGAGYVMGVNITAQEKFKQLAQNPSPETATEYANFMTAEQERINPGQPVSLLPKTMIDNYKNQFQSMSEDPKGAEKATATLGSLHKLWGNNFPLVVEEMRAAKAMSNSVYVVANMMGVNGNNYLAKEMLMADAYKSDDLKSKIPNASKSLEADINEEVIKELKPFMKTMTDSYDGLDVANRYQDAIVKTVLFRSAMKGKYSSSDVEDITKKVLLDHYNMEEGYRVPKVAGKKQIDVDQVNSGVKNVLSESYLNNLELAYPNTGTRPEDAKQQYIAQIRYGGKLINAGDDGLRLVVPVKDSNELNQVYRRGESGKMEPLVFSWAELQGLGIYSKLGTPSKQKETTTGILDAPIMQPAPETKKKWDAAKKKRMETGL